MRLDGLRRVRLRSGSKNVFVKARPYKAEYRIGTLVAAIFFVGSLQAAPANDYVDARNMRGLPCGKSLRITGRRG